MKLTVEELYDLAKDRPLSTVEIHSSNDFYGNAAILKQYAKFPNNYQIKAAVEHGAFIENDFWNMDIKGIVPAIFIFAQARYPILKALTNKSIFSIGPILSYAQHFLNEDSLNSEKQRLGKNLLVLAGHSTHWVDCNYNIEKLCQLIKIWGKDFNTIRICLYWKDILRGHAKPYLEHGFECVTAGHIFDPSFLPRLKSIIELSTITASNILGTHIGYCVLMNKPHFYYEDELKHTAQTEEIVHRDVANIPPEIKAYFRIFSQMTDHITSSQKEFVERHWGINDVKNVDEMQMIFQATEDMYRKGRNFYMSNRDVLTEQAIDYLNQNKGKEALFLFENSIKVNDNAPWLGYGKSIALAQLGQKDKAIETLKNLLAVMPENQEAQQLLNQLSQINTIGESTMQSTFNHSKNFFGPVILNPGTLARIASSSSTWQELLAFHSLLATDEYVGYLDAFYRECIKRYGSDWYYLDIVNVLYAASKTIQPRMYLEIGVRRGRSVCSVARGCSNVGILGFDMWLPGYAGMENPGPDFVKSELKKHGHTSEIFFVNGDSHQTVPAFFKQNPQAMFDMITVDGDHTEAGALDDLKNVIPHLSVGGVLVFDDIAHPAHPYLLNVWKKAMAMFPFLNSFEFTELGYGVAFAIRKG